MSASSRRSGLHVVGSPSAPSPLIERVGELEVLRAAVDGLADGGRVVVVEAAAGLGKTALLEYGADFASAAGCLVRRAVPGPLERHFEFGVVRALLDAPLRDASEIERAYLLDGAAAMAGELLLEGMAPGGDSSTVAHSVLWLCSAFAARQPLVLVVDDAQWADRRSLEVLSYLARRIEELPLLILVAVRADDPDAARDLLSVLGSVRSATLMHPQPLTQLGALQLIRRVAPETPAAVCRESHRAVAGNPWLLNELGRQIAEHGPRAIDARGRDASPVTGIARTVVRRRLADLCPPDRAVVEALAVLGECAAPHVVAAVAGLRVDEVGPARDALVAAGLLADGGERFAHPLIAAAIAEDLPRTERERLHREAARALVAGHGDGRLIACHLLKSSPQSDPEVSRYLQLAASKATRLGRPQAAVAYLERALDERAPGDDHGRLLARLSTVVYDAGLPHARKLLREALGVAHDRESRIEVLTRLAALNLVDAADDGLAEVFEQELAGELDPDGRLAVEAASLDALLIPGDRQAERARRVAALGRARTTDPLLERVIVAHRAWLGVELGDLDANACAALALKALDGDVLLREAHCRAGYALCTRVLITTEHPHAGRAIAAMREAALERGSLRLRVAAEWHEADHALRTGRVATAENLARMALELADAGHDVFTGGVVEVLVCALTERGAFDEAHALLRERGSGPAVPAIGVRHARARLSLAEGDFQAALAEAMQLGEPASHQGRPNPSLTPWRSTAARALAHIGRRDEAAALADAELTLAASFGAPAAIAGALHARAVAEPDHAARVRLCERALTIVADAPYGLEAVRLRLELGSAQASMCRRTEAREALRPALADADAAGAVLLAQRARRELVATGLRPRQAALAGAAALTPRQRQICELAAAGKGNRAIAQELFLSVKTVETHLAAAYRKLGVATRADLGGELAA